MANLTLSDFEPAMKTDYLDGINDNSVRQHVLLSNLGRDSESMQTGGNFAQLSLLRRGNPGIGSRAEATTLPTANFAKYEKATFTVKSLYGRGSITGQTIRASNKAAFIEALDAQMNSLMIDLPTDHNRQLFGDATGALAALTTNIAGTTAVEVDSIQYLAVDDVIDIRNTTSGVAASAGTNLSISAIDEDSLIVTVSAAVTAATASSFYLAGARTNEIHGLESVVNNANPTVSGIGNYGGINRTTKPFWKATVMSNSGTNRPLTRGLMMQAKMKMHTKGKGHLDMIVTHPDMWATYGNMLAPDQRWNDLIFQLDGGFDALNFVGAPVVFDIHCKPNRMFFLDFATLFLLEYEQGYQWMEDDGNILRYQSSGDLDVVTFGIVKEAQLGCRACNRLVKLADLANNLN